MNIHSAQHSGTNALENVASLACDPTTHLGQFLQRRALMEEKATLHPLSWLAQMSAGQAHHQWRCGAAAAASGSRGWSTRQHSEHAVFVGVVDGSGYARYIIDAFSPLQKKSQHGV